MTAPVYFSYKKPLRGLRVNNPVLLERGGVFRRDGDDNPYRRGRAQGELWSRLAERAETHQ